MEAQFLDGCRWDLLRVFYHPYVLLHQGGRAAAAGCDEQQMEADEGFVVRVAIACVLRHPAPEHDAGVVLSEAAVAMANLMRACSPEDLDVVMLALWYVRVKLQELGLVCFSHGLLQGLHTPLLSKSVWRQQFFAGELEDGTPLLATTIAVFKAALECQMAMLCVPLPLDHGSWKVYLSASLLFCMDFDDTCTCKDTTQILVSMANTATRWVELMDSVAAVEEGGIGRQQGSGPEEDNLRATLLYLEEPEKRVDQVLMLEGLLKGITKDKIKEAAEQLSLAVMSYSMNQRCQESCIDS